jgi:hypothetical protein
MPAIDSLLQSINKNLLTRLEQLLKIKKDSPIIPPSTEQEKSNNVVQKSDNTEDTSNSCVSNVDVNAYPDYVNTTANLTPLKASEMAKVINDTYPGTDENLQVLRATIYTISYINSYQPNSNTTGDGQFKGWNNNFGNISLYLNYQDTGRANFDKSYSCVNVKDSSPNGKSQPLVSFSSLEKYVKFMGERINQNTKRILDNGILEYYVCNWPKNGSVSNSYFTKNIKNYEQLEKTILNALSSAQNVGVLPKEGSDKLKKSNKGSSGSSGSSGTSGSSGSSGTSGTLSQCVPQITSFTPIAGNTGSIVQINGSNINSVTEVTVNGTQVQSKDITRLNSNTMRIVVPQVGDGNTKTVGKIVISDKLGSNASNAQFTYNPAINPQTNSVANTNPQESGIPPLISFTSPNILGTNTDKLIVDVNLSAGLWDIEKVIMSYTIKKISQGPNNTTIETLSKEVNSIEFLGYVSNDKQKFEITNSEMKSYLKDNVSPPDLLQNSKVNIQFTVTANAIDKVKYPQSVEQSYNFFVIYPPNP